MKFEEGDSMKDKQLKVLCSIQNLAYSQLLFQESIVTGQLLSTKTMECLTKQVVGRLDELNEYLGDQPDPNIMSMQFKSFSDRLEKLGETIKDLFSTQRSNQVEDGEQRKKVLQDIAVMKDMMGHTRTNTKDLVKTCQNMQWEIAELRTGGKEQESGKCTAQGGSLLSTLGVLLSNHADANVEHLAKSAATIVDGIEKGEDPAKSLKRKFDEIEKKREEEEKQRELDRQKTITLTHPFTGVQMVLNQEEYQSFLKDMAQMKPTDFASRASAVPPPGFPPPMPGASMQFPGGLPPPHAVPGYGQPGYGSGTPTTPAHGSFKAPAP